MIKYAVVVPYAWRPYFDAFIETVKIPRENMLLVDDTSPAGAIGIMKAHNMGLDFMRERGADWLIVMSAAIRFGEPGGMDFIELVEQKQDHLQVNGQGYAQLPDWPEPRITALGWHLTAFNREVFENCGRWDENFTPYGFDDTDLTLRIRKFYGQNFRNDSYPVDMSHESTSHSIQLAGVVAPSTPRLLYFVEKWGRHPGAWQWDGWEHPFNNPEHSIKYWPDAPNGGKWNG